MASIYVPEDVVIDILSRLRVKSLFRFKCVCKPWCALIDNSSFIAKHSLRSNLNEDNGCLLLEVYPSNNDNVEGGFFLFSEETLEVLEKVHLPQDFNIGYGPYGVRMVASCGGIICLYNYGQKEVTLWNPATGELKVLHGSAIPLYNERKCNYHVGFGFDAKRNDYKVIRIVSFSWEYNPSQVEVYSLSRDTWRIINAIPLATFINDTHGSVYLNGIAYWICRENYEEYLLSFDMSSELFNLTPLPLEHAGNLTVVNGSVAVASYGSDFEGKHYYETWVLKIASCDGQGKPWEFQDVGPIFNVSDFPLRHTKNRGLIFCSSGGQLFFYDLITLQRKYLGIKVSHRRYPGAQFIDYKESLYRFHSDYSVERPTKMTKRK